MIQIGVNIDHVATVREARRGGEPDPLRAAHDAILGGAHCITVHLREDRRHINDDDVTRLRDLVERTAGVKLNLEMAATSELIGIARNVRPHMCTLVPERRMEITTEGGLDVVALRNELADGVAQLKDLGMIVSAFIDPDPEQVAGASKLGCDACELHTGPYAHAFSAAGGDFLHKPVQRELERVRSAGQAIVERRMRFHAGHALNYHNVQPVAALSDLAELHIGHAIVSRAIFTGLREAVAEMIALMREAAAPNT
ncbi:MAG: pyridoxine 5'-phosphate synthase [Phycisphaerales bacterium]|nr:pyridoxine 5'-phosphate synthase [Phycisphaerales bacterium]